MGRWFILYKPILPLQKVSMERDQLERNVNNSYKKQLTDLRDTLVLMTGASTRHARRIN